MDSGQPSQPILETLRTVEFRLGLKGYNVDEVDEFLERLSGEVRQLKDLVHQQRQQLRQAAERISQLDAGAAAAPTPAPAAPTPIRTGGAAGAEQVTSMIAMAQRFIDQAQQEAEAKAREFTVAAQERAREIVAEARSRAEDEVNRLNGLKQRLSEDVETLSRQFQAERSRIAQILAEFTRWVETSLQGDVTRAPATAAHAAPPAPPSAPPSSPPAAPSANASPPPAPSALPPRPSSPPPAPAPTGQLPTIGQVLKFDQSPRDDR